MMWRFNNKLLIHPYQFPNNIKRFLNDALFERFAKDFLYGKRFPC